MFTSISWEYQSDIYAAIDNSDAVILLTEWEDYKNLDWKKLQIKMRKPSWVFDTRSVISPDQLKLTDINFWQLGNGESC